MQHVLVASQYEEASSCSILTKCKFCNFTLLVPLPLMPGTVAPFVPPFCSLHAPVCLASFRAELLKWRTAVRIRTSGWWRPDRVSLSKVYSLPRSFYPKILRFWPYFWSINSSPTEKWLSIKLLFSYIAAHTWVGLVMFIWFKVIVSSSLFNNSSSLQCPSWWK